MPWPCLSCWGSYFDTTTYFEAALIIAVMGFISTVATSKYLMRGDIVE
jgi:multicomponent K+:H+ antiporter subunit F